jgi:hypothetical protein
MPAVQAIKALEQLDDIAASNAAAQRMPGLQIVIVQAEQSKPPVIDLDATQVQHD